MPKKIKESTEVDAMPQIYTFSGNLEISGTVSGGAAAGNWWEELCIPIAAFQPKGAASYADSLIDLSGNGNDATEGVAPDWNTSTGWDFGASTKYLIVPIVFEREWSYIVQFTDVVNNGFLFGTSAATGSGSYYGVRPNNSEQRTWYHGAVHHDGPGYANGNMAAAGNGTSVVRLFFDGVFLFNQDSAKVNASQNMVIGAWRYKTGALLYPVNGKITAIAFFDQSLTDAQMLAAATSMAAI